MKEVIGLLIGILALNTEYEERSDMGQDMIPGYFALSDNIIYAAALIPSIYLLTCNNNVGISQLVTCMSYIGIIKGLAKLSMREKLSIEDVMVTYCWISCLLCIYTCYRLSANIPLVYIYGIIFSMVMIGSKKVESKDIVYDVSLAHLIFFFTK
tara:strand:+ start:283 stop:744 length:462 start_codon:yes stop_codon:yes gene_type:complete